MSLKYIFGGCGFGKTGYCLADIKAELKNNENYSIIYIVPEQSTHQSERNLIDFLEESSLLRAEVLSFKRLGYYLFSKEGNTNKKIVDDTSKNMILKKIIIEKKSYLKYYNKSIEKVGFIDDLNRTITEFFRYSIDVELLNDFLHKESNNNNVYNKVHDLYIIYKTYIEYLNINLISNDTILDFLPEKILNSKFLSNAEIWIDDFYSFTPQEYKIIRALMKKVKRINITLTLKDNKISYSNLLLSDYFFETKNTVNIITKLANELHIEIEKPILLTKGYRFLKSNELKHLEDKYFNYYNNKYLNDNNDIFITENDNIYNEVNNIAAQIIQLIRDKNFKYNEISILTGDMESYKKIIESVFYKYDINYFIDSKEDITSHPLSELIVSSIDILASNWSYESVFRFLKTNITTLTLEQIYSLENYVLAYDIREYKWFFDEWKFGTENEFFDVIEINKLRKEVIRLLTSVTKDLNSKSKVSVNEYGNRIFEMLKLLDVPSTLKSWIEQMQQENNYIMLSKHSQIWTSICNLFDKMVEILGNEKFTPREFLKVLECGLRSVKTATIPLVQDKVIIGDFERSRFPKTSALFVVGVNEGIIPKFKDETGFFSDDEKSYLLSEHFIFLPDSKRKNYEEQFIIYSAITKAEKYLYFSYNIGNLEGKPAKPSALIKKILNMFPNLTVKNELQTSISLPKAMFYNMGNILRQYIKEGKISELDRALYNWFKQDKGYSQKINAMETILKGNEQGEVLSQTTINRLYGNEIKTSVSRLERYMSCPYAYFVEYNLKAKERKLYELGPIDFGNIFHDILEMFSKFVQTSGKKWRELKEDEINMIVNDCVNQITSNDKNEIFQNTHKNKFAIKKIKRLSSRSIWALVEHIKSGSFEPLASEISFSDKGPINCITININEKQKITLTGRIDRIDIYDNQTNLKYVKIIDYKTGNTKFNLDDLYFGTQLQLILYIDAFIKNAKTMFGEHDIKTEFLPGGIFYFNIKDPIIEMNDNFDKKLVNDLILQSFKMSGLVLSDKDVISKMDSNIYDTSSILPVKLKKDGEFSTTSSIADVELFNKIRQHAVEKVIEISKNIFKGNINAFPYSKGSETACKYCPYSSVCLFELKDEKNKFNVIKKHKFDS